MNGPTRQAENFEHSDARRVCLLEPWAEASATLEGSEALAVFAAWLDEDLARLTAKFEDYATQHSRKKFR